jgi:uncharacterized repeat protein (TIGR01451 family)
MSIALRDWRRALVLVAAVGMLVVVSSAQAQQQIGATATKDCPPAPVGDPYTIGDTVTCTATFTNVGAFDATVTLLTETAPFVAPGPGPGTPIDIECTLPDGTTVINEGDTLPPGMVCTAAFGVTIPNDPALCNTAFRDRAEIGLEYPQFTPPETAGAFATNTLAVLCPADISITKMADALSKVGDDVTYTFEICNLGVGPVDRVSVIDTLLGDITASFPATLAPGECATVVLQRTVADGDADPLPNTVTAIYSSGPTQDTATASASTELFQPSITLDKTGDVTTAAVGDVVNYTITVTNTSSMDSPNCVGSVVDTLLGVNQAIDLASGASVVIPVSRAVTDTDPDPLVNTATATCSPVGFPNVLSATDMHSVDILPPPGGEGCTPGFWKQDQHFDSWVGFLPDQTLESVFDVPDDLGLDDVTLLEALSTGGGGVNALLRHAVAALLNASSPDVDFDLTVAQVISATNAALASGDFEAQKDIFAGFNEQSCPLS